MKEVAMKFLDFLLSILKVKEWWKFYGILIFLSFISYLIWGGGVGHMRSISDMLLSDEAEIVKAKNDSIR